MNIDRFTFKKSERIVSQKVIDELFSGTGSHSKVAFPVRVVFTNLKSQTSNPKSQILISVPKRRFRHAVDRNRVKRQLREAYRTNKHLLLSAIPEDKTVCLAFIWLSDKHLPTAEIVLRVKTLLTHIAQTLEKSENENS